MIHIFVAVPSEFIHCSYMQDPQTFDALAALDRDLLEDRARAFIRVRDSGKIAVASAMMTDTVAFEPCLSCRRAVRLEGKSAVESMLRQRHQEFESGDSHILHVLADHGHVVVRRRTQLRHRGTNAVGTFTAVDIIRFRDGLIDEFAEYTDTAAVDRLSTDQPDF